MEEFEKLFSILLYIQIAKYGGPRNGAAAEVVSRVPYDDG